jgi:uncharacterized protein (TIGR00251 family)
MAVPVGRERESCPLSIRVQPRASRSEIAGFMDDGSLKVRLKSAPTGGRANKELMTLLAGIFGVSVSSVRIVRGITSRHKSVVIEGVKRSDAQELLKRRLDQKG